ncbi:hypothetical protein COCMIDRAFT_81394 [Bipolaris oryzae ATCC 44560]|uniref:Uncharacterized protein n=1 Tax=Bipolaris oryzae ATCC 44560 TaxID=930090 RepID=W6ZL67_COCMI|nr:uncharacterized protein COCMIDRAFT_81394 [Bipolaris oryzae ATCC 44560]EUC50688.1 hypothetical protein COCMIDRAFT_81394 [Bipolaris oryzae ATCC 44560]
MDTRVDSLNTSNLDYAKYLNDSKSSKYFSSHKANLSGATMLDLLSGTEGSIAAAYQTSHSKPHPSRPNRPSDVSSSKNELRQTNRMLVEIVQNAQLELATQRQTMLDMQSRILQLEHVLYKSNSSTPESFASTTTTATTQRATSQTKPVEEKILVNSAAQHQASSLSVTPTNKPEFWKSPSRFSGFNFNFDLLETQKQQRQQQQQKHTPETPQVYKPSRPPAPPAKSPRNTTTQNAPHHNHIHRTLTKKSSEATLLTRPSPSHDTPASDIKEHIVEYEHVKIPFPPLLHSPPKTARSKLASTVQSRDDELTALPRMPEQVPAVVQEQVVVVAAGAAKGPRRGIKHIRISRSFSRSFRIDCGNGGRGT